MSTGRVTDEPDSLRIDAPLISVGAKIAYRGFDILAGGREGCVRAQRIIDGCRCETSSRQPATHFFAAFAISAPPAASMDKNHQRQFFSPPDLRSIKVEIQVPFLRIPHFFDDGYRFALALLFALLIGTASLAGLDRECKNQEQGQPERQSNSHFADAFAQDWPQVFC